MQKFKPRIQGFSHHTERGREFLPPLRSPQRAFPAFVNALPSSLYKAHLSFSLQGQPTRSPTECSSSAWTQCGSNCLRKESRTGGSWTKRRTRGTTNLAVSLPFFPPRCLLAWTPSRQTWTCLCRQKEPQRSALFPVLGWGKRARVGHREGGDSLFVACLLPPPPSPSGSRCGRCPELQGGSPCL